MHTIILNTGEPMRLYEHQHLGAELSLVEKRVENLDLSAEKNTVINCKAKQIPIIVFEIIISHLISST